jgi:hypothetical protein
MFSTPVEQQESENVEERVTCWNGLDINDERFKTRERRPGKGLVVG